MCFNYCSSFFLLSAEAFNAEKQWSSAAAQLIMEKNPVLQNFLAIGTGLKLSFSERL
jgi:hypothetical protein